MTALFATVCVLLFLSWAFSLAAAFALGMVTMAKQQAAARDKLLNDAKTFLENLFNKQREKHHGKLCPAPDSGKAKRQPRARVKKDKR